MTNNPVDGLIQYINTVKPFHSKIFEVLVEYIYQDKLNVSFDERYVIQVTLQDYGTQYTCEGGFGIAPYGTLKTLKSRRTNPYYNNNSQYYNPVLDSDSEQYDPKYLLSSPGPSNKEQIVSLFVLPPRYTTDTNKNPFYDPSDVDYRAELDLNNNLYDPQAFNNTPGPTEMEKAVSLPYMIASELLGTTEQIVINPFYDSTSSFYVGVIDSNNPNYDDTVDPSQYSLIEQGMSLSSIRADTSPFNPFFDPSSNNHVPVLDRNNDNYDQSIDPATYSSEARAVSLYYLPYVDNSIESNWDNNECPYIDPFLLRTILNEDVQMSFEREGIFNYDFLLLFDMIDAFDYSENSGSPAYQNSVAIQQNYTGTQSVGIAKTNTTLPQSGQYYCEFSINTMQSDIFIGLIGFDPKTTLPFERDGIPHQHLGTFARSIGLSSQNNFNSGDIVGVQVDQDQGTYAISVNGSILDSGSVPFSNVAPAVSVGLNNNGDEIQLIADPAELTHLPSNFTSIPLNT